MKQQAEPVTITVYRITGRQGFIDVPHRYCEECDLTVQLVRGVIEERDMRDVTLQVRPWMLWFWRPLLRGGWHAPIVTVNSRIVSQGVVPERGLIVDAIESARGQRQSEHDAPGQLAQRR